MPLPVAVLVVTLSVSVAASDVKVKHVKTNGKKIIESTYAKLMNQYKTQACGQQWIVTFLQPRL